MGAFSVQNTSSLPNLKKYFILIIIFLLIVILCGELYQDYQSKQEYQVAQRLHTYHQQYRIVTSIMDDLKLITGSDVDNLDYVVKRIQESNQQLLSLQDDLKNMIPQHHLQRHRDDENQKFTEQDLLSFPNTLPSNSNILSTLVAGNMDSVDVISMLYAQLSHGYFLYQEENQRVTEKLSHFLQQVSYQHRMVLWGIVIFIMLIVVIVGILFYHLISGLVTSQFELLQQDNLLRQQNEKARAEQEKKLSAILNSTVDGIITMTEKGLIESFNQAAEKIFAYPAESVIGKNIKMLMPEPYSSEHDGYLAHYHKTGEKKVIGHIREVVGRRIDGNEFPLRLSVSEVDLPQGRLFTGVIQDITERKKSDNKLQQTLKILSEKQQILVEEEKIARHVFENITATNNDVLPEVSSWSEPMGTFSGDLTLSTVLPSGGIRILLCDFTGHGLPAALGAVPVSSTHRAMANKDLPLDILMNELNHKLKELLPTGIFCCIAGIDIDDSRSHAHIWNAGLPDVLVVSQQGEMKDRISSTHLPLGVMEYSQDEMMCVDVHLESGDMIYTFSDGVTEAESESGEMYGQSRFEQLLMTETDDDGRLIMIKNELGKFVGNAAPTDDLSLIEIKTVVTDEDFTLKS